MLNFDAYNIKELQNFLAFLNQCEAEGVTDIRFVRQRAQEHINTWLQSMRQMGKIRKSTVFKKPPSCPSCGSGFLVGPYKVDGLIVQRCSRKCGYSEVIA